MEELTYHVPVLLNESIEGMNLQPKGIYVDVTFGGGGHSKEIANKPFMNPEDFGRELEAIMGTPVNL